MLMILLASLAAFSSIAAEPATKAATQEKPSLAVDKPASDKDQKPADAKAGDEKTAADKAGADKGKDKASPQRFIPSEQVRADFDVSFPVDI